MSICPLAKSTENRIQRTRTQAIRLPLQNRRQLPRGRMGAIAKKMIGVIATAAAAAIVTMFTDKARVESAGGDDRANVPARSRTPIAEASVMINPITLLRRRR
jgi:hypothetical protein